MEKIPSFSSKVEKNDEPEFEHSPENYKKVIFWSFLLSQGNQQIQKEVLNYVVNHSGPFDPEMYDEALQQFADTYFEKDELELSEQLRTFHKPIKYPSRTFEYDSGWLRDYDTSSPLKILKYQLSYLDAPPTRKNKPANLKVFSNGTWESDLKYFRKGGRPNRDKEKIGSDAITDQWFSFGVSYLIRKNKTSVPLLNQMLEEASLSDPFSDKDISNQRLKQFGTEDLFYILSAYNKVHPDKPVTTEEMHSYLMQMSSTED